MVERRMVVRLREPMRGGRSSAPWVREVSACSGSSLMARVIGDRRMEVGPLVGREAGMGS